MGNSSGYRRYVSHKTHYCLWYNGQVYRINDKFSTYLNNLIKDVEDAESQSQSENPQSSNSSNESIKSQNSNIVSTVAVNQSTSEPNTTENQTKKKPSYDNEFPTPEYIYRMLLDPCTRNQDEFFKNLKANGFKYIELMEYANPNVGTISYTPDSHQDSVFIIIHNKNKIDKLRSEFENFFKQKLNCSIDIGNEDNMLTMSISYDY